MQMFEHFKQNDNFEKSKISNLRHSIFYDKRHLLQLLKIDLTN